MSQSQNYAALAFACALVALPAVADDALTVKISGRVQIDYNIVNADTANLDISASEFRRVYLGASGTYGSGLKYKAILSTNSSGEIKVQDAFLDFTLPDTGWAVKTGHMKTPNSLDEQTSSRFTSTLERSAFTDAFAFNRRVGVQAHTKGDNYTFAAGVFGENLDVASDQEGYAIAARATYTPINEDGKTVHLGASARYREAGDTSGDIRYRQRPFAHIPGRVISTGSIARNDTFFGVEAAGIFDQLWLAGEYGVLNADGAAPADPSLSGHYLEAGYFFGGHKVYKSGKFNRPSVDQPITEGGMGAVSLVARYDSLDLNDTAINGGELETLIIGADWWPTRNTRIGLNYFNGDVAYGTSTSGLDSDFATQVTAGTVDDNVSGVVARLQFDF